MMIKTFMNINILTIKVKKFTKIKIKVKVTVLKRLKVKVTVIGASHCVYVIHLVASFDMAYYNIIIKI